MYKLAVPRALLIAYAITLPSAALAEIPEPVKAMIDAAVATGDQAKIDTVLELARKLYPDDAVQIDGIAAQLMEQEAVRAANEAARREQTIRNASFFEGWSGKGELGAFNATGNSSNTGVTASLDLTREGINWRHKLRARGDFQRSNGVTTREQFLAAYEPNLKLSERLFAYALAQYERDRFQGFSARYSVSGGLGYDVIVEDDMTLAIKAGPAYRRTERINGSSSSNIAGLASLDFDWGISDTISFTQDASAFVQSGSSTLISDTGLQAGIADSVTVRLSYTVEHDTQPPAGAQKTDTLSRVTIIYDF